MTIRRKLALNKAHELLRNTNQSKEHIDVEGIAKHLGITVRTSDAPSEDVSGFLFVEDNTPVIGLNKMNSPQRRRFTLAHEIGHYVLHHLGRGTPHIDKDITIRFRDSTSSEGIDDEEIEANLFAAELLMPMDNIERSLQEFYDISINKVEETIALLAKRYGVSPSAMTVRLSSLGLLRM